jgi:pyrroline-5-carboxylate reductase
MLSESDDDFETLRNKVTSPNGVTFEALEVFKVDQLGETFDRAFEKNFSRSLELREEALKMNL